MAGLFETTVARYTARLQADLGLKGFQADGLFGNLGHESDGFSALQERDPVAGQGGYGWAQWTGPRRKAYLAFCSVGARDPRAPESNYLYLVHDFREHYPQVLLALRATRTRDDAVDVVMNQYEVPGVPHRDRRVAWAVRAQSARMALETATSDPAKGPTMDEVSTPAAAAAPPPAPAPVPQPDASPDALETAIGHVFDKLEAFAIAQAKARGVPAFVVSLAETALDRIDVPHLVATHIRSVDVEALAERAFASLVSLLAKKAA